THRRGRGDVAEPWVRRRSRLVAARHVRAHPRERQRSDARGHGAPRAARALVPVPSRIQPRPPRLALLVPQVHEDDRGTARRAERGGARGSPLMPVRPELRKVMVIGAGPIVIGQACEFDYSGTQGCRALRSLGIEVVLLNSNPATIMTDPE